MRKIKKCLLTVIVYILLLQAHIIIWNSEYIWKYPNMSTMKTSENMSTVEGWPPDKDRNVSLYITNPVTSANNLCDWTTKKTSRRLLIAVKTGASYLSRRKLLRQTWANSSLLPDDVQVIFIIGIDNKKPKIQYLVEKESQEHCDTFQANSIDGYFNKTLKIVAALKYFHESDEIKPEYVMIIDDDSYINVNQLYNNLFHETSPWFWEEMETEVAMIGQRFTGGAIMRPDPKHDYPFVRKSVCPEYMYPEAKFPAFLSGGAGYLFPYEALSCLAEQSLKQLYLHIDDVFITGIVAEACKFQRINSVNFSAGRKPLEKLHKSLISIHYASGSFMEAYHNYFHNRQ